MEAAQQPAPATARVYICTAGHRTVALWRTPTICQTRVGSRTCGLAVLPLAEAPADAKEKMLNPLKASKKAAKKK